MRALSFSFLLLVASCAHPADEIGGTPPDDRMPPTDDKKPPMSMTSNEIKTGTRLRSRFATGDDGSQIALGLYDSKLNIDCQFTEAEDGKQRCLPTRTATLRASDAFLSSYGSRSLFKDNACTERLAMSSLCDDAMRYIKFSDTCGGRTRIANAVEIAPPSYAYYRSSTGGCSSFTVSSALSLSELRFYTVGTPVQPQEFVSGMITTD